LDGLDGHGGGLQVPKDRRVADCQREEAWGALVISFGHERQATFGAMVSFFMASKMGEMASREATEAGALKAVRPERGREGDIEVVVVKVGRRGGYLLAENGRKCGYSREDFPGENFLVVCVGLHAGGLR
jgi:hypothetical protein